MKLTLKRSKTAPETAPADRPAAEDWTGRAALTDRAIRAALAGALLCGPAALGYAVLGAGGETAVAAKAPRASAATEAEVSEFATAYVTTWLTSTQQQHDKLDAYTSISNVRLPQTPFRVSNPTSAALRQVKPGLWSVTVAVDVATVTSSTPARRYFQAMILRRGADVMTATAMPAPVSGPALAEAPELDYTLRVSASDPLWSTTEQFAAALAAGQGDIARYLTPSVEVRPIVPAPYKSVRLLDLTAHDDGETTTDSPRDGEQLRVLARLEASITEQQRTTVEYALTLQARAGRWEIKAVDAAPLLRPTPKTSSTPGSTSTQDPAATQSAPATQEESE